MGTELTLQDLEAERVDLLPAKETLHFNVNWANVWASNSSLAFNAASLYATAHSSAYQTVVVNQS
jgi:hypothetical protein